MFCFFTTKASENINKSWQMWFKLHFQFFPHLFNSFQPGVSESQNISQRERKIKKLGASYRSSWAETEANAPAQAPSHCPVVLWTASLFPIPTFFAAPLDPHPELTIKCTYERRDLKEKQVKQHNQRVGNGAAECRIEEEKLQLEVKHLSGRGGLRVMWNSCPGRSSWVSLNLSL